MSVASFADHPFPVSDDPRARKRLSTPFVVALSLSVAAHAGVGAYLAYKKFVIPVTRTEPDFIDGEFFKRPDPPPPPEPKDIPQEARKETAPIPLHDPIIPPFDIPVTPLHADPTIDVDPGPRDPPTTIDPGPVTPPQPKPPAVIARPDWLKKPTATQFANAYPERALLKDIPGTVRMTCKVTAAGAVNNCAIVSETPADYGFGDAALKLSRNFKMKPQTVDGQPVEGASVTIPLSFNTN